jgi:hypothetical protein
MFLSQAYALRGNEGLREKWQFCEKTMKIVCGEGKGGW